MRIVTVALGSFIVGALCVSFWGSHTSTLSQPLFAQTAIHIEGTVPVVPPLRHITSSGGKYKAVKFEVDGIESTGDTFTGVTFVYGGGAYKLADATVVSPVNFEFTGAAANTVVFLSQFGMIGCPASHPQEPTINPNSPVMKTAKLASPYRGDLVSPFGQ